MPITQSAKKALRQGARREKQNQARKRAYKTSVKNYRTFLHEGKKDEAKALLPKVFQSLDKAAKTHVIEKNKARRLKSHLSKNLS